jgi:hypothetical protein
MRYSLICALAAVGCAGLRWAWHQRSAIPDHAGSRSPGEILLQKQEGLAQAAAGGHLGAVAPAPRAGREWADQVAKTAYFLAERRGFAPGREADDWFVAEAMVAAGLTAAEAAPR